MEGAISGIREGQVKTLTLLGWFLAFVTGMLVMFCITFSIAVHGVAAAPVKRTGLKNVYVMGQHGVCALVYNWPSGTLYGSGCASDMTVLEFGKGGK